MTQDADFALGYDLDEHTFGGAHELDIDIPATITTVHAAGSIALDGVFEDEDSFDADIASDIAVAVGGGTPTSCSAIDLSVTGTRD